MWFKFLLYRDILQFLYFLSYTDMCNQTRYVTILQHRKMKDLEKTPKAALYLSIYLSSLCFSFLPIIPSINLAENVHSIARD